VSTDRVAIVTGAARGLGKAFARRFARDGYCVVVADQNTGLGLATAHELGTPDKARFIPTDVSEEASCVAMVDATLQAFGRVDVLVNNAGLARLPPASLCELEVADWDRVMNVNARGVWLCIKAVVPTMRAGGGSIINVSSNTFLSGRPNMIHYLASKGAVIGITRTAARELGEYNIRVNAILPGSTLTDAHPVHTDPERARVVVQSQAIKRDETPEDIVGAVAFLASDDARFITGQALVVDGGLVFH